jgi:hypothetical protein
MAAVKQARACILTINGGSSSIKFALFDADHKLRRILAGRIERIGLPEAAFVVIGLNKADNFTRSVTAANHTAAVGVLMDWIEKRFRRRGLTAVGHRVVHGGPKYSEPQRITTEEEYEIFEPANNPGNDKFYVNCADCDREIEFGWSQPNRGGRIFPVECSDFLPGEIWPEPRYLDSWHQKHWLRTGDGQP